MITAIAISVAALCVGLVAGFALGVLFVMQMTSRLPGNELEVGRELEPRTAVKKKTSQWIAKRDAAKVECQYDQRTAQWAADIDELCCLMKEFADTPARTMEGIEIKRRSQRRAKWAGIVLPQAPQFSHFGPLPASLTALD